MGQMTLLTGAERRRRWSEEARTRILDEIEQPGAVIAEVARRADICTSLIYKWRREALKAAGAGVAGFAPVVIEAGPPTSAPQPASKASEPGVIVVEVKDARVRIGVNAPSALIAATLKALRS
jgi:transposase